MFAVLGNRNYAFLWLGGLISNIGDWVLRGALPFFVYAQTHSTLATGLAFIAGAFPWVILSSVAGVFTDRWSRKFTMIVADISRGFLVLLLLLVVLFPTLFWLVYVISFLEACITQFFNPAAIALIPHIVDKERLQEANSFSALGGSVSRLIGPLLGGVLLGVLGLSSTVIADSISYFFSALMILLVLIPSNAANITGEQVETTRPNAASKWIAYWHDWLEGLSFVVKDRFITILFLVIAVASLADGIINPLFVVFPAAILHLGSAQYGEILTALGIGSILGSILIGRIAKNIPALRFIWTGLLGKGIAYLLIFNNRSFPLVLALFIVSGVPTMGWQISIQTLLQTQVEDRLRGRVFGAYVTTLSLLLLIGTAIGSTLATPFGTILVLNIGSGFFILGAIIALLLLKKPVETAHQQSVVVETEV